MLSKKECKRALENMHSQVDIETQWYSYDILKKLIDEHFGVKSEKELQNIYLNNNLDEVIEIQKNNLTDSYMIGLYNGLVTAKNIILDSHANDELVNCIENIKPYKFEDLKEGMWVYDIKYDEFCRIDFIAGIYPHRSYSDGTCEDGEFEENRFFPVQHANPES